MNDKWYESLGEAVNRLAQTYLTSIEKGKVLEKMYLQMVKEDECRARGGSRFISTGNECPLSAQEVRDNWNMRATHPYQWQGLTDDEIDALEHNDFTCWGRDDLIVFGRAIEQALRIKNGT
jgi:hypothetical protein